MNNDDGVAIATEYVLLLGVSLLIFSAIYIGLSSFSNTAVADARSEAAYRVAALVGQRISEAAGSQASVDESVDLPERICGLSYVVYPSGDGRGIYVLVGREAYEAPIIAPADIRVEGFMVSTPGVHRIEYEASSKTLILA